MVSNREANSPFCNIVLYCLLAACGNQIQSSTEHTGHTNTAAAVHQPLMHACRKLENWIPGSWIQEFGSVQARGENCLSFLIISLCLRHHFMSIRSEDCFRSKIQLLNQILNSCSRKILLLRSHITVSAKSLLMVSRLLAAICFSMPHPAGNWRLGEARVSL